MNEENVSFFHKFRSKMTRTCETNNYLIAIPKARQKVGSYVHVSRFNY